MYSRFFQRISPLYIFFFSFFIISQLGKHYFFHFSYLSGIRIDYLAPTIYFIDILSLPFIFSSFSYLFSQSNSIKEWIKKNIFFVVSSLILLGINCIFSLSKPLWFYGVVRLMQFICIYIYFQKNADKKNLYSAIMDGLLMGTAFELGLALMQLSARHSLQGFWYYLGERSFSIFTPGIAKAYFMGIEFLRPYGTFSHPNSLGGFYLLVYIFILTQKRITNSVYKGFFLFVSSALILLSFSRTAIAVYILINLFYFSKTIAACKVCFLAKISLAFVLVIFILNISGDINSFQKRTDFLAKSITIISQKPFSGTGIGSYLIAQNTFPQKFSTFFEQPVHNIFFLLIAQLGVPLSILLFTSIFRNIDVIYRKINVTLPLVCIILTGSVDHYWITLSQNQLVLAILFGILFSYEKKTSRA